MRFLVLKRFSSLLVAHIWREILLTVFLLSLARTNPTAYGEMMLAMQLGAILLFLSEAGMNPYLVEHLTHDPLRRALWLRRFAWIRLGLLLVAGVGAWFFTEWQDYSRHLQVLMLVMGSAIGLEALTSTYYAGLQVAGKQHREGCVRGLSATLGWGYALGAMAAGWGVCRISIGKWIETLIGLFGAWRSQPRSDVPQKAATEERPPALVWRDSLPFAGIAVAAILFNKANIFFLQRWAGSDAVAQYSATWQVVDAIPILMANLLLGRVLYPMFVLQWSSDREGLGGLVRQVVSWLSLLAMAAAFTLALANEPVIRLLYGPAYGQAAGYQPLLVWCIPFSLLHNVAAYLLLAAGRRKYLVSVFTLALALNLLICRWWIPKAPLEGAVWAMIITKGTLSVLTVSAACRLIPFWRMKTLIQLGAALLAAGILWFIFSPFFNDWALIPSVLPLLALAAIWFLRDFRGKKMSSRKDAESAENL